MKQRFIAIPLTLFGLAPMSALANTTLDSDTTTESSYYADVASGTTTMDVTVDVCETVSLQSVSSIKYKVAAGSSGATPRLTGTLFDSGGSPVTPSVNCYVATSSPAYVMFYDYDISSSDSTFYTGGRGSLPIFSTSNGYSVASEDFAGGGSTNALYAYKAVDTDTSTAETIEAPDVQASIGDLRSFFNQSGYAVAIAIVSSSNF
jgi:hypothetical protein